MPADHEEPPVPLAEISQGPNAFEQFLDRNQKNIVILAILLVIGTAAFVIYRGVERSRQETAGAHLVAADDLASLQTVINDHAGSNAAQSAMVILADRQWNEGQQDEAIETLRNFISTNNSHPALPTAQASLGSKLMAQGKADEAAQAFEDIIDNPEARFLAPYALISIGDMAKAAGDTEKAKTSYTRVTTEYAESAFVDTATRRLDMLDAKSPVEVAPPAEATPETTPPEAPSAPDVTAPPAVETPSEDAPDAETPPAEESQDADAPPAEDAPAETPAQEDAPDAGNEPDSPEPSAP